MENKTKTKERFKDFVLKESFPDPVVFLQVTGTNSNTLAQPIFADLRELALAKMVTYLKDKLDNSSVCGQDSQYDGVLINNNKSHLVYDALKNETDKPILVTKIVDARRRHRYKVLKDLYFWFASSVWLTAGAILLAKLSSLWL